MTPVIAATREQFFACIETYLNHEEMRRVEEAYEFADQKHGDQIRKSGEPFITHPLTVAFLPGTIPPGCQCPDGRPAT